MDEPVTEETFVARLIEYVIGEYSDLLRERAPEYPYDLDGEDDDYVRTQVVAWFVHTASNPETGTAIVEEFADRFVSDSKLASRIRRASTVSYGEFEVLEDGSDGHTSIRDTGSGAIYPIRCNMEIGPMLAEGVTIRGMIHPWGDDGTHKLCGIMMIMGRGGEDPPDYSDLLEAMGSVRERMLKRRQDEAESISVTSGSRLAPALKKYPAEWVEAICASLGVDCSGMLRRERAESAASLLTSDLLRGVVAGLPEQERDCLEFVAGAGGSVRYGTLQKRFGADDTTLDWSVDPQSAIGNLRKKGILLVGKQRIGSRSYKVAAIAADVLANLRRQESRAPERSGDRNHVRITVRGGSGAPRRPRKGARRRRSTV